MRGLQCFWLISNTFFLGIDWRTPRFPNSCSIDCFLSAFVRKIRQTHGQFLKHIQLMDHMAGKKLFSFGLAMTF